MKETTDGANQRVTYVDVTEVNKALGLIGESRQVIEVRALEASLQGERRGTLSGYFDDHEKLVQAVAGIRLARGIYFTLNPLKRDLLARAVNRIQYAKRGEATADGDMVARRWMLVDIDPVRPSGISASDAEHEAALAKAETIATALGEDGWPEPIIADSGNGAHLLYRIDLPTDDGGLVERCLRALADRFDDEAVTIDRKVFNLARICRLYGTTACKGDHTAERPHRRSRIVKVPSELLVVEKAKLDALAGPAPMAAPDSDSRERTSRKGARFDVAAWIREYDFKMTGPDRWRDRNGDECDRWVFDVCPFNPEHTNRSAFILQFPNGAISAGCHHNGCAGKDWHALREVVEPGWRAPHYNTTDEGLFWNKPTQNGTVSVQLTNFSARIVAQVVHDDGVERRRSFEIEARHVQRIETITLPTSQFTAMNWPVEHLGATAIVYPGLGLKDHARAAIQVLSDNVRSKTVFTHLGWRKVEECWVYLHAGGAIAPEAPIAPEIQVEVTPELARLALPDPPVGNKAVEAVAASLQILGLAKDEVIIPVFAAIWRSVLGPCDFTMHLSGGSGTFKTELAALAQQHFGSELDSRNLPGSWSSTGNALENLAFSAKDVLLVVDDFAPSGTANDVARLHREAARLIRAQGNRSGRGRLRADATLRPTKCPRGLILSTGEDVPAGHSVRARIGVVEIESGTISQTELTRCQRDARHGLYSQAMAAFLLWLAPRYGELRLSREIAELREAACSDNGAHRRTPELVANLFLGIRYFARFSREIGVFDDKATSVFESRAWSALRSFAAAQIGHLQASDPVDRFCELLASALASGRAHVADPHGEAPQSSERHDDDTPKAWGWRRVTVASGHYDGDEWRPQGARIGWYDVAGDNLYLDADAAFRAAQDAVGPGADGITVTARTLVKRLRERGSLRSTDTKRNKNTVQRVLQGQRHYVVHLKTEVLTSGLRAQRAHRAHGPVSESENGDDAPETCARNAPDDEFRAHERAHSRGQEGRFAPNAPEAPEMGVDTPAQVEPSDSVKSGARLEEDVSVARAVLGEAVTEVSPQNLEPQQ